MKLLSFTLMLFPALLLSACLGSDDDNPATETPNFATLNCTTSTDCADNSANGATFYFSLIVDDSDCSSLSDSTDMAYVRGTAACTGGTCTGTSTTSFISSLTDQAVATPTAGTYSAFGFIDTNGNEEPDSGEPGTCSDSAVWDGSSINASFTGDLNFGA